MKSEHVVHLFGRLFRARLWEVNLMHTIDPDLIVLGGAMTFGRDDDALGRRFRDEVQGEVRRRAFPVPAGNEHNGSIYRLD